MASKSRSNRVTLSAVADHAKVALSTASIVLSGNSAYLRNFSKSTIRRVRASAEKLGYRPSLFASGLPSKGSSLFFVVALHDLNPMFMADRFLWGFDGDLLGGIAESAMESRVYPILALTRPDSGEQDGDSDNLDRIVGGGVFGAIIRSPSASLEKRVRHYLRQSRPVAVVFPRSIKDWQSNVIDVDNVALGKRAGQLLAGQGRRRWVIVLDPELEPHQSRLLGVRSVAREQRAQLQVVPCSYSLSPREASAQIAPQLKRCRADGVFALTARSAEAVLDACRANGVQAGPDLSLIGCDCSVWHRPLLPRITSVEACWREAGHTAVRMLLEMRNEGTSRCAKVLLSPVVVAGDTCPETPETSSKS